MKHKPHWYKFYITACSVCGRGDNQPYKVREYGEKPAGLADRYEYVEQYCHCLD